LNSEPLLQTAVHGDRLELKASGAWTTAHAQSLERLRSMLRLDGGADGGLTVDVTAVEPLDTMGALVIDRMIRDYERDGRRAELVGLSPHYRDLYRAVRAAEIGTRVPAPPRRWRPGSRLADRLRLFGEGVLALVAMTGAIGYAVGAVARRPRRFRFTSAVYQLDAVAWRAIPIIIIVTALMGGIIAQQGVFYFRQLGVQGYVVDLVGILTLRGIGVMMVAIMIAGRTGSAYAAELGAMKMREEIDALRVMALDPVEVLVLPRILALIVAMLILSVIGDIASLVGGALVCWFYGGINPEVFIATLKQAVTLDDFLAGVIKAPFMAVAIGVVACSQGFRAEGSVESIGRRTTAAVVQSILLVILIDGLFSFFFAAIGL
jgi:phospholipid/cholesterol/gamma-HCH transport system permease protein